MLSSDEKIYIDQDGDFFDTLEEAVKENAGVNRSAISCFIREDLVYEKSKVETVLTVTPLFSGVVTDPQGNVWVKLPLAVR